MSFKNRLMFSLDFIQNNRKKFLGEVILLTISFFLFFVGMVILAEAKKFRNQVLLACKEDISNLGYAYIPYNSDCSFDDLDCVEEALSDEGIEGDSYSDLGSSIGEYSPIYEMMREKNKKEINNNLDEIGIEDGYKIFGTSPGCLDVFSIELEDGKAWTKEEYLNYFEENTKHFSITLEGGTTRESYEGQWYGIYLGYNYMDVAVGKKVTYKGKTIEVLGHLKKNSIILRDTDIYNSKDQYRGAVYYSLDDSVLFLYAEQNHYQNLFRVKKGENINEICQELNKKYNKNHIIFEPVENVLDRCESENKEKMFIYLKLFFLISVVSLCAIICVELVSITNRMSEFGVMFAGGATNKDLLFIMVGEIILKLIMTIMLVFLTGFIWAGKNLLDVSEANSDYFIQMKNLVIKIAFPKAVLGLLIVMIMGNVIPLFIVSRLKPVELLRGNN